MHSFQEAHCGGGHAVLLETMGEIWVRSKELVALKAVPKYQIQYKTINYVNLDGVPQVLVSECKHAKHNE